MLNAEPDPPHIELGQTMNASRRKGNTIVRTDGSGQSVFAKQSIKDRAHADTFRRKQTMTSQQITRMEIRNGERIAVNSIAGSEVSLEIGCPQVIGVSRM